MERRIGANWILTGPEGTKLKVAAGDYDTMIDKRIAEIQQTCGIQ